MFSFLKKRNRFKPGQAKAEREAIRLLKRAQQLLLEDPRNADEAKRLRFEVTHKILPPNKMYIVGKHPQSLLRDVDRKIQHAYARQINENGHLHQDIAPAVHSADTKKACDWWNHRYGSVKGNLQRQFYWTMACFLFLSILMVVLLYTMSGANGGGSFSHSFKWVSH